MLAVWYLFIPFITATQSFDATNVLQNTVNKYVATKQKPVSLQHAINNFFENTHENASCTACVMLGNAFITLRKSGASFDELGNFTIDMCIMFTKYDTTACTNYVHIVLETILFIVDNKTDLSIKRICSIQLQERDCIDESYMPWSISIPEGTSIPLPDKENDKFQNTILHLTDIHFDLLYQAGSAAICNETLCCQTSTSGEPAAGYWGDYHNCDMPWYSVEDLLTHIQSNHPKIDLIYFTGDIVNHNLWDTSNAQNSLYLKKLMQKLYDTFGKIPIYSVLGNHEVHPVDLFGTVIENFTSTQSLYKLAADEWGRWLPLDTRITILKGGYYTVLVNPKFRIIGLNNNVCVYDNAWLAFNEKDPYQQLQWLADTLILAERNGEAVHIIGHLPPAVDCFKQWNNEFVRIISRFHNTITGQFYGHTHFDEMKVFYNTSNWDQIMNVAFISGSFSTYVGNNPTYRMYYTSPNYNRIIDYDQWIYNLSEANENPTQKPNWFKLYSFKEAYGVKDMTLPSFNEIVQNMIHNWSMLLMYETFRTRDSSVFSIKDYSKMCLTKSFCSITNVNYQDSPQCETFKKMHV